MANEIELKLAFPADALQTVLSHPLICNAPRKGEPRVLDNTYFDTPALTLHAERIAIRTRRMGTTVLQTIKCAAESVGGLSSRPEWEQPFNGKFDFAAVDNKSVRKLLQGISSQLVPVFTTVFHRETRIVQPVPEVCILVMIDTGKIFAGTRETPICELELELAQGAANDLQNFAIELAEQLPLIPFDLSKAQRGYQLFCNEVSKPLKFGKTPLLAEHSPLQAFRAIAIQVQAGWLANLHGALASSNPEFIHQFRVALRRLKTLLKTYKPILPAMFVTQWSATFSALANISGEARDLDVLRENILQPMLYSESESRIEPLMQRSLHECASARTAANASLANIAHGVPLLRFAQELQHLTEAEESTKLLPFARQRLKRMHARTRRKLAATLQNPTPEMTHRLRIAFKNLRYCCDFFAPLFEASTISNFTREVAELQEELGFLHDLEVALNRLDSWAKADPELNIARQHVEQWYAARTENTLGKVQFRAKILLDAKAPWQKAR